MTDVSDCEGAPGAASVVPTELLQRWNIAAGNFFFRYRNAIFPSLFVLSPLLMRPQVIGGPTLDTLLVAVGTGLAVAGEAVRLATIGFEYIERGGREGKVYASRLVTGGVYGVSRNPMYVGNSLITIGMCMVSGAPIAYALFIPFFLFIYQAIVSAEEVYLRGRFGQAYETYCASVNRFVPAWSHLHRSFAGMRYNWKRALRQDLSTITGLLLGLALWPLWRTCFLQGWPAVRAAAPHTGILCILILAWYGVMYRLKKRGALR